MKRVLSTAAFFLIFCSSVSAQADFKFYDEISLPQTDAWNFIKQGDVSPSLYTGTLNLSIPIYTYQDKDFTIPVSLDYSLNGNMPNQRAGVLGPGWTLTVGGCITVDVKGIPDYSMNYPGTAGFKAVSDNSTYNVPPLDKIWRYMNVYNNASSGANAPEMLLCSNGPTQSRTDKWDISPDIFHFCIPGHSGTFHLGYGGNIYVYDANDNRLDYKVEIETQTLNTANYNCFKTIAITTSDGYKYIFDGDMNSGNTDLQYEVPISYHRITCWKLSQIKAPNGRTVTFSYIRIGQESYTPGCSYYNSTIVNNQATPLPSNIYPGTWYQTRGDENEQRIVKTEYRTGLLSSFMITGGARVDFGYDTLSVSCSDQYRDGISSSPKTFGYCMRLSSITAYNMSGVQPVAHALMGYKENINGGRTSYLGSVNISGSGIYSMDYKNWNSSTVPYPYNGTFSVDHWGYYNGKNNNNLSSIPYNPASTVNSETQDETITGTSRDPDATFALCGMIEKISYPTGGWSLFTYEPHDYSTVMARKFKYAFQPALIAQTGIAGGLRIRRIETFLSNGTKAGDKYYTYTDVNGSTGVLTHVPRYKITYSAKASDNVMENSATYISSGIQDYGFTDIEYRNATEHLSDSSRIKYIFTNNSTSDAYKDYICIDSSLPEKFLFNDWNIGTWNITSAGRQTYPAIHNAVAPLTSRHFERGRLLEKKIYKTPSSTAPILVEENNYNTNGQASADALPCYLIRRFGLYEVRLDTYPLDYSSTTQYSNLNRTGVTSSKSYTYNCKGQTASITQVKSNGDTLITRYGYVNDLPADSISASTVYTAMINRNIRKQPLSEKVYIITAGSQNGERLIDGIICRYALFNGLIKPYVITHYDNIEGMWYTEQTCSAYDSQGNLLEMTDRNGIKTSYIWGYRGQLLASKCDNVSLSQLTAISGLENIATTPLEEAVTASQRAAIRSAYSSALFTFYEHLPGVGVSKIIDPSNRVITYMYTQWGKLKTITEQDSTGHLLKQYDYSNDN